MKERDELIQKVARLKELEQLHESEVTPALQEEMNQLANELELTKDFAQRRLQHELKRLSDDELMQALYEGMREGKECRDENEWRVIRDTILVINEEIQRRKA